MDSKIVIKNDEAYIGSMDFSQYPFELSDFQKHGLVSIENKGNTLICAPTGSGKTLVAEYIMKKYKAIGKRVIYTSPIKTLSNYLFKTFREKYPEMSIGILTGDIKCNPDADIVIMTTEILRNLLYNKKIKCKMELSIEIDVYTDIGAVIFDEVHYISDQHRGTVWEQCLILLPPKIQLVMLSATIENPGEFGQWIQNIKDVPLTLSKTSTRAVPLRHYVYISVKKKLEKVDKSTKDQSIIDLHNGELSLIFDEHKKFNSKSYDEIVGIKKNYRNYMSRNAVLNQLAQDLKNRQLLPALMFTLSRKKCEVFARTINTSLNSPEEQCLVTKLFDNHLRKSENYENIVKMEQYFKLKDLITKGVAFHHSGVYHIFKEVIAILFEQQLIKILFCTETFAVGVNMPTKTAVFTGLTKYSDNGFRYLLPHEYNQMSGRAGRRGMDKIGTAILLPNLYDLPSGSEMRQILCGKHQVIQSKFAPDFQFLLKLILTGNNQIMKFIKNSLLNKEILESAKSIESQIQDVNVPEVNFEDCMEYDNLMNPVQFSYIKYSKKAMKKRRKQAEQLKKKEGFEEKYKVYLKHKKDIEHKDNLLEQLQSNNLYVNNTILKVLDFLYHHGYLADTVNIKNYETIGPEDVTIKGVIASQISECNEILFTELIYNDVFDNLEAKDLVAFLAIFLDTRLEDEVTSTVNIDIPYTLKHTIDETFELNNKLQDEVLNQRLYLNTEWKLSYNMIEPAYCWVNGMDVNTLLKKFNVFEGNFIRDMIKLSNVVQDVVKIATLLNKPQLVEVASSIEPKLLRSIVSIESLYVK